MKPVTSLMINEYKIRELGFDFMGYTFVKDEQLSFHHLVIPKRDCRKKRVPSDGYIKSNGSILRQDTSHDYLHRIEPIDREVFLYITDKMLIENVNGKIDLENLRKIRSALEYFEKEHCGERISSGKVLIKREYVYNRILF